MGAAVAVQAKYEKTSDPKKMMTHALLNEAIRTDFDAIRGFLPARTATSMRYDKGATKAVAWDEGAKETGIDLPLQDGWYVPDGNPFAIPNGRPSNKQDPNALYLVRHQNRSFSGPLGRSGDWNDYDRGRGVVAYYYWFDVSGVVLIGRPEVRSTLGASDRRSLDEATAPVMGAPKLELVTHESGVVTLRGSDEQIQALLRVARPQNLL